MPPRRDLKKEAELEEYLQKKVTKPALRITAGLFKSPGDKGYNPDAELPWKEATVKTRAALLVVQGEMAAQRARGEGAQTTNVFGMVMMQPRIESENEWEAFAKQVHGASQQKAIEAAVVSESEKPEDD